MCWATTKSNEKLLAKSLHTHWGAELAPRRIAAILRHNGGGLEQVAHAVRGILLCFGCLDHPLQASLESNLPKSLALCNKMNLWLTNLFEEKPETLLAYSFRFPIKIPTPVNKVCSEILQGDLGPEVLIQASRTIKRNPPLKVQAICILGFVLSPSMLSTLRGGIHLMMRAPRKPLSSPS